MTHANRAVGAEQLALAIWGGEAPADAINAVHAHVSRLRRVLGEPVSIVTVPAGYELRVRREDVDASRFEDLVRAAEQAPPAEAIVIADEALGLWRGEVDAAFPAAEVVRLGELRLRALETRAAAAIATGRSGDVLAELAARAAEHPEREGATRQLMVALYGEGRHAEALDAYRRCRDYLARELGLEPSPALRDLEQAVLEHDAAALPEVGLETGPERRALGRAIVSHRLPGRPVAIAAAPTPTFGREDDVRWIGERCGRADVRLLTLTGPGGVGKTRLALEVARAMNGRFVSLAPLSESEQIAPAICDALDVTRAPGEPAETALYRALSSVEGLLVLDNLEHLAGAAAVVARLLESVETIDVLATSRQPLGLQAEHRYPVGPLPDDEAVRLFESRARARVPGFAADDQERAMLIDVCRRLGGLPLAIELAAARIGVLDVSGLSARLSDTLSLLGPGPSDAPERQRTLRATLDWSYELLGDDEREAFIALGVFTGGGTLEAAEEVTRAPLRVLQALVDKGLVTAAEGRLSLLEPVRQYVVARVSDTVRTRHFEHYLALAERTRRELWLHGRASPAFAEIHRERDNLRAALEWAVGSARAVTLVGALDPYWWFAQAHEEGRRWSERVLQAAGEAAIEDVARARLGWAGVSKETSTLGREQAAIALELFQQLADDAGIAACLLRLSGWHSIAGDQGSGFALAEQAAAHARAAGDPALAAFALTRMAMATADIDQARALLEEGVEVLRSFDAHDRIAGSTSTVAFQALHLGAYDEAERLLDEALPHAYAAHSPGLVALVLGNRGVTAMLQARLGDARAAFAEQLTVAQADALIDFYEEGLLGLAALAANDGNETLAATLEAAAHAHSTRPLGAFEQPVYDRIDARYLTPARERLGEPLWKRAAARGARLSADEAIALAVSNTHTSQQTPRSDSPA